MLSPLLAVLLSAASDSASPAPVPTEEPSPQATSLASSPTPSSSAGSLVPGSWGLGFRVLGNGQDLVLRRAISDRWSAGARVRWGGSVSEDFSEGESRSTFADEEYNKRGSWGLTEEDDFSFELGVPVEWLQRSARPLRFAASAGPVFEYFHRNVEVEEYFSETSGSTLQADPPGVRETNTLSLGIGMEGAVGVRWFFLPDLAVAADFGTSAVWTHTTSENSSKRQTWRFMEGGWATHESKDEVEHDRVSTNLVFLGVGLEAWF